MIKNLLLPIILALFLQYAELVCQSEKSVAGVCYFLVSSNGDNTETGCLDECIYEDASGDKFCFRPGNLKVEYSFPSPYKLRRVWTCEHCRDIGKALAYYYFVLTTEEALAVTGNLSVKDICPYAEDKVECQEKLPSIWSAMIREIMPTFSQQTICDMQLCPHGKAEVKSTFYHTKYLTNI